MIQRKNNCNGKLYLAIFLVISNVFDSGNFALAQPIPDETLGTESSIINSNGLIDGISNEQIDGGASRGTNLFHSFQRFNISNNQQVNISNPSGITNILVRVTGSNPSEILGTLKVLGNANLFLLNPNGVIFGPNATLALNGSFIATTANNFNFNDGTQFSATRRQTQSSLTMSAPIGLQFGRTEASILVQDSSLEVKPGKTLALLGGDAILEGAFLSAPSGRIELGSVTSNSLVNIKLETDNLFLSYQGVQKFRDIQLKQSSLNGFATSINVSGESGGNVHLQGKQVIVNDGSQILSNTNGAGKEGSLIVDASELLSIGGISSKLSTLTSNTGDGGNITINTNRLVLQDGGEILTDSASSVNSSGQIKLATGRAGNLTINATESVELLNSSKLSSETEAFGKAGDITIDTRRLVISDKSDVSVFSSSKTGNAGNLKITADLIQLENGSKLKATNESGNSGGNITINNLDSLLLRDNSEITTDATAGEGNGGNITIATDLLTALENSSITANAEGAGNGGNIRIKTQGLFLSPDSIIDASSDQGVDGVVEIDRLENPEGALLTLPAEPVNISGLIAQGCSSGGSVARGSKFVVTGRGGLPPTPKESSRGDIALADLGKPIPTEATQTKVAAPINRRISESTPLVEAQGWVINTQGEVMLTASAPNVTPSIPWMKSNSCHG